MKEYTVLLNGLPYTVLLDEAEAERVGAVAVKVGAVEAKQAPAPENKARTAQNKSGGK